MSIGNTSITISSHSNNASVFGRGGIAINRSRAKSKDKIQTANDLASISSVYNNNNNHNDNSSSGSSSSVITISRSNRMNTYNIKHKSRSRNKIQNKFQVISTHDNDEDDDDSYNNNLIFNDDAHSLQNGSFNSENQLNCNKIEMNNRHINVHNNNNNVNNNKIDYRMDYELLHWIFILFFTFITVLDRYTLNIWPLWVSSPGPTIPNNFSVTVFSIISWISSRMLIVSSSYIFLFQCHIFWNWFVENRIINKYIIISDIHQTNTRLHYHIGWLFIGIPVVLHVWSIVFAACFPQNSIFIYNSWMRPNDSITGQSIPFYSNNLLSLGINDVYRIVSTSISFFILFPYSIIKYFRNANWSFAQWIHLIAAAIYVIDLLRMKSHPHCWIFNIPFMFWWIADRLYGIFYYRRCCATVVRKTQLDSQYCVLYLRIPKHLHLLHTIGDIYYFNILDCGWDRAHPFTVFQNYNKKNKMIYQKQQLLHNWSGHKFSIYNTQQIHSDDEDSDPDDDDQYIMSRQSTVVSLPRPLSQINKYQSINEEKEINNIDDDDDDDYDWNIGIIMQIVANHSDCYHRKTWTSSIFVSDPRYLSSLRCWGPYRSEYRILLNNYTFQYPLVLIGTGAGCSFLLDFYYYIISNNINLNKKVIFYFSTRSISMFQWFTDITCHKNISNLFINAHLTSHNNIIYNKKNKNKNKSRDSNIGRLSFEEILNSVSCNTKVFFCGSPLVQEMVRNLCKKLSLTYHAGHSFHG